MFFFFLKKKNVKQACTTVTALANPVFTDAEDGPGDQESRRDVVVIDSLFVMDQFRAAERVSVGRPHTRDIADVTAMAEAVLPKGSARISTAVRRAAVRGRGRGRAPPARVSGEAHSGHSFPAV